ncbi:START domain-containing protein 10 isoform X5 [Globicephala melas]|uniref:START domain-containing protein 10 isoform X5 n=1 Tax=Globicephala melas TaxID=9731 RepID=UPI0038731AF3
MESGGVPIPHPSPTQPGPSGERPCSVEMTTKGQKLRRNWRILKTEDSVAGAVQTLLLRRVAQVPGRWRQHLQPRRRCWSFRGGPRRAGLGPGLWASPMEKSAASTEPQGPRPVLGRDSVQVPDDQDFRSFRSECEAEAGWNLTYSKAGVSVWVQAVEMDRTLHKIKLCSEGRIIPVSQMKILGFRTEVLCPSQGHTGRKQQDRGLSDQTAWNCCKCELVGQRDGPSLLRGDFQVQSSSAELWKSPALPLSPGRAEDRVGNFVQRKNL